MLSQFNRLALDSDGRYANDLELRFIEDYLQSYQMRINIYKKLQDAEQTIVQQVYNKLKAQDPSLLIHKQQDMTVKWKRDTIRVLRYSAVTVLTDDTATFQERLLLWFQTIMRAFGAQRSCEMTYTVMQEVIQQHFTAEEYSYIAPVLDLNRTALGTAA
ncbi:MAG: phycobilisome protein [Leptolyngbya sp. DLM2.Bin15]|nr:MAG: phycobilisome protein [Leptolyngbya sp. DLM2.Bin15]